MMKLLAVFWAVSLWLGAFLFSGIVHIGFEQSLWEITPLMWFLHPIMLLLGMLYAYWVGRSEGKAQGRREGVDEGLNKIREAVSTSFIWNLSDQTRAARVTALLLMAAIVENPSTRQQF